MSSRLLRSVVSVQHLRPTLRIAARTAAVQVAWQKPVFTTAIRCYAKKAKDSKKKSNVESKAVREEEEDDFVRQFNEKDIQGRYESSINSLKEHFSSLRIGRANPCKFFFFFFFMTLF